MKENLFTLASMNTLIREIGKLEGKRVAGRELSDTEVARRGRLRGRLAALRLQVGMGLLPDGIPGGSCFLDPMDGEEGSGGEIP